MHSYMAEITKILGQGSPGQVVETEHEKVLGDAWPNHAPRTSPTMGIVHTTHVDTSERVQERKPHTFRGLQHHDSQTA
jgi:hypothetical protein